LYARAEVEDAVDSRLSVCLGRKVGECGIAARREREKIALFEAILAGFEMNSRSLFN
jgi:hypothetical protein